MYILSYSNVVFYRIILSIDNTSKSFYYIKMGSLKMPAWVSSPRFASYHTEQLLNCNALILRAFYFK